MKTPSVDEERLRSLGYVETPPGSGRWHQELNSQGGSKARTEPEGKSLPLKAGRLPAAKVEGQKRGIPVFNPFTKEWIMVKSKTEARYVAWMASQAPFIREWFYEPLTIRLDDGSRERYSFDFEVVYTSGRRDFIEIKPHSWIPREGRLGISKMKRGAKRLRQLLDAPLYKASYRKGVWHHEEVE